jgi:hypothetical protein
MLTLVSPCETILPCTDENIFLDTIKSSTKQIALKLLSILKQQTIIPGDDNKHIRNTYQVWYDQHVQLVALQMHVK